MTYSFHGLYKVKENLMEIYRIMIKWWEVSRVVVNVHRENFDYKRYTHHANPENPQFEIKSGKSNHIAAHKGSALTCIKNIKRCFYLLFVFYTFVLSHKRLVYVGLTMDITTISDIRLLMDSFYIKVKKDSTIGPVFNERIGDWENHLQKMYRFWQTMLLGEHTYHNSPFPVHAQMPIDTSHFNRWTFLWCETVDQYFEGAAADEAKWRGDKMAAVFLSKIMYYRSNNINPIL